MEEQRRQQPQHASPQAWPLDACPEDEIDLLDLWGVLVRQWKVIFAITGLSVFGAVVYVLLATPVYEAQAVVQPPESKYVAAMNISDISEISSADIFSQFTKNLNSRSLRQQYFDENAQYSVLGDKIDVPKPKLTAGKKEDADSFFVSLQGHDSKLVADWVNGFILLVDKKTINDFFSGIETKITNRKKTIENQLQAGLDFASKQRQDRLDLLDHQIAIARASNIIERRTFGDSKGVTQGVGVTLNGEQELLYMRGVKELTAEKEELQKRKNDEPFIPGFRDQQKSLAQLDANLKQFQAAKANATAVKVDQQAIQPKRPVRPKRMLVLALSGVLGGGFGIFTVFVINGVQKRKAKTMVNRP